MHVEWTPAVTARNHADAIVHATRSSVKEMGDKLSEDERKGIEKAIEGVETAMNTFNGPKGLPE